MIYFNLLFVIDIKVYTIFFVSIHIYPIFTFGRLNWRHISFLRFLRHRIDAKDAPICVCAAVAHSYSVISSSIDRSCTPASCIGGWLLSLCGSVLCFCIEHSCTPINPSLYCFRSARFVSTRSYFLGMLPSHRIHCRDLHRSGMRILSALNAHKRI